LEAAVVLRWYFKSPQTEGQRACWGVSATRLLAIEPPDEEVPTSIQSVPLTLLAAIMECSPLDVDRPYGL
jgi:hypothetical protein